MIVFNDISECPKEGDASYILGIKNHNNILIFNEGFWNGESWEVYEVINERFTVSTPIAVERVACFAFYTKTA